MEDGDTNELNDGKYIDENFIPRSGDEPINETDRVAMRHDIRYAAAAPVPVRDELPGKHAADRLMLQELEAINPASFGERVARWISYRVIHLKEKLGMGVAGLASSPRSHTMTPQEAKEIAKELHAPLLKHFPRRKIITNHLDEIWSVDLMIPPFTEDGFKFVLVVIDNWSKYLWCISLKSKTGINVTDAFEALMGSAGSTLRKYMQIRGGNGITHM